jgi:hypothetical protein
LCPLYWPAAIRTQVREDSIEIYQASMFFSEEKNQKTFMSPPLQRSRPWPVCLRWRKDKSLLLLFFRKGEVYPTRFRRRGCAFRDHYDRLSAARRGRRSGKTCGGIDPGTIKSMGKCSRLLRSHIP